MQPLDDYYLWCDHRAWQEAAEITEAAHEAGLPAIDWCGGMYSSEWGFSKLLHWLRHNPEKRERLATRVRALRLWWRRSCAASRDPAAAPRSICAMGHKWMWNRTLGGLPPEEFLDRVWIRCWRACARSCTGATATSESIAGHLSPDWAEKLGLRAGIPIPVGAFDAHWDAIGAGVRLGDVVNVIGTSTCIIAMSEQPDLIPGVCGVVPGSVHPAFTGIEAGLSATGDIFDAIARRAGIDRGGVVRGSGALPRGPDRAAAADLGQRRPDGAGESRTGRRDARLALDAHGAG